LAADALDGSIFVSARARHIDLRIEYAGSELLRLTRAEDHRCQPIEPALLRLRSRDLIVFSWSPSVGAGVNEIRVHAKGEHRIMYVAKFDEAVCVLHAFEKKTQRTPQHDIELAGARFRGLVQERRRERR
jgi:putative component of toxin-antitoxin plasmid stabilization module